MKKFFALVASSFAIFALQSQAADTSYQQFGVTLLQPELVLKERVLDVSALASYLGKVSDSAKQAVGQVKAGKPSSGYIVFAVKPGGKSNVWLDFSPALSVEQSQRILAATKAVMPFEAKQGIVLIALKVGLWGGAAPESQTPFPPEWKAVASKNSDPVEIGKLVETVWPN